MFSLAALYHQHEEKSFVAWMRNTNQMYTGSEYQTRFGIWMANKRLVQEHNSANKGFIVAMNHLAAMTPAEYKTILGFKPRISQRHSSISSNIKAAADVDWRDKGKVNDIKDQSQCGSCWAFSAIQAVESGWAIKTGELLRLSEQNLVDCDAGSSGCEGGIMTMAYNWVINRQSGKFMLEMDYPYTGKDEYCKYDASKGICKLVSYIDILHGSEADLAAKVQVAPVAIAIDASNWSFQMYSGGIYDERSCSPHYLDHGVGAVGFGTEGSKPYWIVRNSWGKNWGEKGYIRMVKDMGNQCGEASMACQPQF